MASLESYKHKAAKAVVVGWLRDAAAQVGCQGQAKVAALRWRVNRGAPGYGVWEEYPIAYDRDGHLIGDAAVWDETAWWADPALPFRGPCQCEPFILCECGGPDRPPTYDELIAMRYRPHVIFDVAVQHKGALRIGIEIVHTAAPSAEKQSVFEELGCEVYVLDAEWVLRQVGPPRRLVVLAAYGVPPSRDVELQRHRKVA